MKRNMSSSSHLQSKPRRKIIDRELTKEENCKSDEISFSHRNSGVNLFRHSLFKY